MPSTQITNPAGAFNQPYTQQFANGLEYIEVVAAATITAGQVVSLNTSLQAVVGTAATTTKSVGVALDTVVSGQTVRIQTSGLATVVTDGSGVTAGVIVSTANSGQVSGTPSTTIGQNIGLAITTAAASAGTTCVILVAKL